MERTTDPKIIQGGMGIAVSGWRLAREVSRKGQLGVVSGTALNAVFAERLQDGDVGGHLQRALSHFPFPDIAASILRTHLKARRTSGRRAVRGVPMFKIDPTPELLALTVAANFCEVFLAKEGHDGVVGINLLEKVQLPNLASLYGAMLAGVDYVLMGAGIPREIPLVLDRFSKGEAASLRLQLEDASSHDEVHIRFDPKELFRDVPQLARPKFLAIVSSDVLAQMLLQKATSTIHGLVIENPHAGGHNAPPRGGLTLTPEGEPVYGPRDTANLDKIRDLSIPFWLAGDQCSPEALDAALAVGAQGIQVGTAFAFCKESGLDPELRKQTLAKIADGSASVFTDPSASPTGFPFKVVELEGTLSEQATYEERPRLCQLGFLRRAYRDANGKIGYRCPGEPVSKFLRKGGNIEQTVGKKCLCNALMANIGLGQEQSSGYIELPLLTAGDSIGTLQHFVVANPEYSASDVIEFLLTER